MTSHLFAAMFVELDARRTSPKLPRGHASYQLFSVCQDDRPNFRKSSRRSWLIGGAVGAIGAVGVIVNKAPSAM